MDAERNTVRRALMRDVNDRIVEVNDQFESTEPIGIICECVVDGCVETITVERGTYDDVRRHPGRYVLVPGHEAPEDRPVGEPHETYVVVDPSSRSPA